MKKFTEFLTERVARKRLFDLMKTNVVIVRWDRRIEKPGSEVTRQGIGTTARSILNSKRGKKDLKFKTPKGKLPYSAKEHNLVTYWDLHLNRWRSVSCEGAKIIRVLPLSNISDIMQWWSYYDTFIRGKSDEQLKRFFDEQG